MRTSIREFRLPLLLIASALATACGSDGPTAASTPTAAARDTTPSAAVVAATGPRNFRCDGTAGGRIYAYYTVTGQLTAAGQPVNVLSYPTYYPASPGSYRKSGLLVANYQIPPSFPNWRAWNVTGHANGVGTRGDLYFLVLPKVLPGRGGITPGELHIQFNGGQYGWWQVISSCAIT
jgi:hypothetical protein